MANHGAFGYRCLKTQRNLLKWGKRLFVFNTLTIVIRTLLLFLKFPSVAPRMIYCAWPKVGCISFVTQAMVLHPSPAPAQ